MENNRKARYDQSPEQIPFHTNKVSMFISKLIIIII